MPTFLKALLAIGLVLGLASTIAASSHRVRLNEPADTIGWFGLYGVWNEGDATRTSPFLPLPECIRCGRDVENSG